MPSVEKFKETLNQFKIDESLIHQINEGYETLISSSSKEEKAAYFQKAMKLLDASSLPQTTITALMDANACCKTGSRKKASLDFAKNTKGKTLEEKIELIQNVPNMGIAKLINPTHIYVLAIMYLDGDKFRCACPSINDAKDYLNTSPTYCKCCAGHFRFHYELMLGLTLKLQEVFSSPFTSNGEKPCAFIYEIISKKV